MQGEAKRGERRSDALGGGLVALSSLLFAIVPILARLVIDTGLPIAAILAVRFALTVPFLGGILLALRRPLVAPPGRRLPLLAVGAFGYAVEASLYFSALEHGSVAAVTLLFYTYPVFVGVVSWLVGRRRPTPTTFLSLAFGVIGAGIIVSAGEDLAVELVGVAFALGSAFSYTAMIVWADSVFQGVDSLTGSLWVCAGAALGLMAWTLVSGSLEAPGAPDQWWPIIGMAVATTWAFWTLFAGLRRLGAVRAAIVASTEPLAVAVLAVAFLDEPLGLPVVAGGGLIVAGAVLASLTRSPREAEAPPP